MKHGLRREMRWGGSSGDGTDGNPDVLAGNADLGACWVALTLHRKHRRLRDAESLGVWGRKRLPATFSQIPHSGHWTRESEHGTAASEPQWAGTTNV